MSTQNSDAGSWGSGRFPPRTGSPQTYKCYRGEECGMLFDNLIDLDIHMQKRGHWRCRKCGNIYADKAAFDQHDVHVSPGPSVFYHSP